MVMSILDRINSPADIKNMDYTQLSLLAKEIRQFLLQKVSEEGGHLSSNLGVVELTLALHRVFNTPNDKIIWDVGHQTYVHKILTGRKGRFHELRKYKGLSGFPKRRESEYDCFDTGHSSTSISAGLGFARARDLKKADYNVVSVIGDGALTGGMAFEALNDAGRCHNKFIVILNDNEMSISKNVGGISAYLSKLRMNPNYNKLRDEIETMIRKIPSIGSNIAGTVKKAKDSFKYFIIAGTLFEELGFKYLGPIDGHNQKELEAILQRAKNMNGPIFIHVYTNKGQGYKYAEKDPSKYHSISAFDIYSGNALNNKSIITFSDVFGDTVLDLAKNDNNIVTISAAMKDGTGLTKFAKCFPDRFFDVGIAEQHAVTFSAGLAASGLKPFISIYSSFYQRAYDQILHDVCLQKLPVVLCIDRAGIVGEDGETHQGIFDIAFLSHIPNLTITAPKDRYELRELLKFAANFYEPIAIRYPKGEAKEYHELTNYPLEYGKSELVFDGDDVTIISVGNMFEQAYDAAKLLKCEGVSVRLVNARFIKPLDQETIIESAKRTKNMVVVEDGIANGGFGSQVMTTLFEKGITECKVLRKAYPDCFIEQGARSLLYKEYGMDSLGIYNSVKQMLKEN